MSTMGYVATLPSAGDAAALNLDFRNQSYKVNGENRAFNDLFTFARGTTAGRWNKNGVYEMVGPNVPRFDYDPLTKVLKGILFEDARTNIGVYSNSGKTLVPTRATYVDNGQLFVDGVSPMYLLKEDTTTANTHFGTATASQLSANTTYTGSYFIKPAGRTKIRLNVVSTAFWSPSNPQVTYDTVAMTATGATGGTGTIKSLGNGFFRITMTATTGGTSFSSSIYPVLLSDAGNAAYDGDGVSGMYIGGYQLEQGAFETSYIPTPESFVSRASTATYFDSKGILQTAGINVARTEYNPVTLKSNGLLFENAATNLFTGSEQINAMSLNAGATVARNTVVAPDGTMQADVINMSGTASSSGVYRTIDTSSATQKTFSVFLKWLSGVDSLVQVSLTGSAFAAPNNANFDLRLGTNTSNTGAAVATITPVGNGWYRCSVTAPTTGAGGQTGIIYSGTTVVKQIAAWGVQVEVGSVATSYIPTPSSFTSRTTSGTYFDSNGIMQTAPAQTARYDFDPASRLSRGLLIEGTRTNSLPNSDNIQPTLWSSIGGYITPNKSLAPDGTLTGSKFTENVSSSIETHGIDKPSASGTQTAGSTYVLSAYFKSAERTRVRIVGVISSTSQTAAGYFDLNTGTVISIDASGVSDPLIENAGNGWYRCSIVLTIAAGSSAVTPRGYFQAVQSGNTAGYLGDGVSGFYVWGPQLEAGNVVTSYIPTQTVFSSRASTATYVDANGLIQTAASGVVRSTAYLYDDNNALKPIGQFIERNAATNICRYSNDYVNGNWTKGAGITLSNDGSLAPDGSAAQKITLSGSSSHDMSIGINALVAGTTYTLSLWMKAIGAAVPSFQLAYYDAGVSVVAGSIGSSVQVIGQWKRYSTTFVCPATTVAAPRIRLIGFSGGLDGNAFYLWNCQLEAGTYATSDIITNGAEGTRAAEFQTGPTATRQGEVITTPTVTRAADVSTSSAVSRAVEDLNINSVTWVNQTEGTIVSEFVQEVPLATGTFRRPTALAAAAGEISHYLNGTSGNMQGFISNPNSQMDQSSGAAVYKPGEVRRAATAYKLNDSNFASKGSIGSSDTSVTIPTITGLQIGRAGPTNRWNGYVRSVNYYPRRMVNLELQLVGA